MLCDAYILWRLQSACAATFYGNFSKIPQNWLEEGMTEKGGSSGQEWQLISSKHNWKVVRKIFNLFILTGILVLLSFFSTKNANEICGRADVQDYYHKPR